MGEGGIASLIPAWMSRIPVHLQLLMLGFAGLHLLGVGGALWYYFTSAAANAPYFKKKMG
jgi:hypothetical protein